MHPFQTAGLGVAPFRWVGAFTRPFACEFCGTAIMINCRVQDANGKEFIVGSDCILKVGDAGLTREVKQYRKLAMRAAQAARIADLQEILYHDHPLRAKLAMMPHPMGFKGKSFLDWCEWMLANAGVSGKLRVARALDKVASVEIPAV